VVATVAPGERSQSEGGVSTVTAARVPRLALVIGSGGVRSIAALGVAEVLWQAGYRPDLVVGCSAGAMFGALLAMGHDAASAVAVATSLWSADLTRHRRWRAFPQMLMPRRFGFDADFCMRSDHAVMQRLQAAFGDRRIEDLPLPLRVTASEAATGRTIVIGQGRLVDALRASIALPFMFKPGTVDGRRLIDGFVSDPLPVGAAADADAIIAVGFPVPMPSRIDGPSRLLAQLTSAMTNNLMEARLAEARARGRPLLALQPGLPRRVGLFETAAMPALVAAGRELARAELPAIHALLRLPLAKAA